MARKKRKRGVSKAKGKTRGKSRRKKTRSKAATKRAKSKGIPDEVLRKRARRLKKTPGGRKIIQYVLQENG